MKTKIAVAVALLVVASAGVAGAHGRRANPEERAERFASHVTRELDLDARQREQFNRLVAEFRPMERQLRHARERTRAKFGTQIREGRVEAEVLRHATRANLALLQQSADLLIERLAEVRATLSPAQKMRVAGRFEQTDDWRDTVRRGGGNHGHRHDRR